mgnify:CR=1 FL=1
MPDDIVKRRGSDGRLWYRVAVALGEAEAAILAGVLEAAAIPALTYRESAGLALPMSVGPLGGIEILTLEPYYEEALALLEADIVGPADDQLAAGDEEEAIDLPPADET